MAPPGDRTPRRHGRGTREGRDGADVTNDASDERGERGVSLETRRTCWFVVPPRDRGGVTRLEGAAAVAGVSASFCRQYHRL